MRFFNFFLIFIVLVYLASAGYSFAEWPAWRYDANRSACRQEALPESLYLQWTREMPAPQGAWPAYRYTLENENYSCEYTDDADKLQFDVSYAPVSAMGLLFVASNVHDALVCYDLATGDERWRYLVDGPVRFAPVVHNRKVYFVSDDGYLYCLSAEEGVLHWRFRGGPSDRLILGNERLINTWPARGAPVIVENTLYFAAGIWPFMGIFIYALDADTGEEIWCNSSSGAIYDLHQHGGAYSFGGVAPQGHLVVNGNQLLVAGGLTVPAVYDRRTGTFLYYRQSHDAVGKGAGGHAVSSYDNWFFNHDMMYSLDDGAQFGALPASVLTKKAIVGMSRNMLIAHDPTPEVKQVEIKDRLEKEAIRKVYSMSRTWVAAIPDAYDSLFFKAGDLYYVGGTDGDIAAVQIDDKSGEAHLVWRDTVAGAVWDMIAADDKLVVVTKSGTLYCFGDSRGSVREHPFSPAHLPRAATLQQERVARILADADNQNGYAQVWGLGTGDMLYALLTASEMSVMAFDGDADKANAMRAVLADADLYGKRASILPKMPLTLDLPPYLATMIVVADPVAAGMDRKADFVKKLFQCLRPYGGAAYLPIAETEHQHFGQWVKGAELENARVYRLDDLTVLKREGMLPGGGQWTHEHATSANTVMSEDDLAKAPLGVLWFGGPSNVNVLPRHGYGPVPQVCQGRLIILGVNSISARDVYSGRQLWLAEFPGIGEPYQTLPDTPGQYLPHQPGAAFVGSCYVSASDGIYVAYKDTITRLNPDTGATLSVFTLDGAALGLTNEELAKSSWGYIGLHGEVLVTGAGPQIFDDEPIGGQNSWNGTSSQYLVVMDRYTGQMLWHRRAEEGFRHNAIVAENDRVFAIDSLSPMAWKLLERRGRSPEGNAALYAFNTKSGDLVWERHKEVFGTWLGYSKEQDILIQAGRGQRGGSHGLPDEPNDRIVALRGADGTELWEYAGNYHGPPAIHSERIIPPSPSRSISGASVNLMTGQPWMRTHPITGKEIAWRFNRTYGCGTGISSKHLLTFRSGAAGFYDLANDGGTGNFGGFRASCTNNLVPADGVLNAPDYTRTCLCSYQNRCSLAMVHTPEVEIWTYSAIPASREPVQRVGLNFGAPGDRLFQDTLWLDYPSVGGNSPDIPVTFSEEAPRWFRMHASRMRPDGKGPNWIGASGVEGAGTFEITLNTREDRSENSYQVILHFSEPEKNTPSRERVFHVALQDQQVLQNFSPCDAAGAPHKTTTRTFNGIAAEETLRITLEAAPDAALLPVLSGVEILREQ